MLDRLEREEVRLHQPRCQTLPLSVYEGTWTHSPPLVAMHLLDRSCVSVGIFLKLLRSPTSSSSKKPVPVTITPISEKANDIDHETSDQVTTEPRSSTRVRSAPEWYGNPVLEVMLLDHDEPTNYEEAMMSPDSTKWLEAMKSEI